MWSAGDSDRYGRRQERRRGRGGNKEVIKRSRRRQKEEHDVRDAEYILITSRAWSQRGYVMSTRLSEGLKEGLPSILTLHARNLTLKPRRPSSGIPATSYRPQMKNMGRKRFQSGNVSASTHYHIIRTTTSEADAG